MNENLRRYSIFKETIASSNTAPPRLGAEPRRSRSKGRYRVAVQNRRNRRTARRGRDASPYWRSDVVIGSGTSHAAAPTAIRDRAFQRGLLHYALSGVAPPAATSSALNGYPGPNYAPHKCAGEWTSLRRLLATRKASAGASRTALHGSGTSAWLDADRKCLNPRSSARCSAASERRRWLCSRGQHWPARRPKEHLLTAGYTGLEHEAFGKAMRDIRSGCCPLIRQRDFED